MFGTLGFSVSAWPRAAGSLLAVIPLIALWGIAGAPIQTLMSRCVDHLHKDRLQGAVNSVRASGYGGTTSIQQIFQWLISPKSSVHIRRALLRCRAAAVLVVGPPLPISLVTHSSSSRRAGAVKLS
jgi:DHA1 family tetracycline resistance protein-like MFS transporter